MADSESRARRTAAATDRRTGRERRAQADRRKGDDRRKQDVPVATVDDVGEDVTLRPTGQARRGSHVQPRAEVDEVLQEVGVGLAHHLDVAGGVPGSLDRH